LFASNTKLITEFILKENNKVCDNWCGNSRK